MSYELKATLVVVFLMAASAWCGFIITYRNMEHQPNKLEVVAVNKAVCKCGRESRVVIYEKGADE
jgi:hypothetical protein